MIALENLGIGKIGDILRATARAFYLAVWPAKLYHELVAVLVIGKMLDCFQKSFW